MMTVELGIFEHSNKRSVLAGALAGKRLLATLLVAAVQGPSRAEPVFLDFSGIDVATASFLRESVVTFRDVVRRQKSNLYPVVANMSETVSEEFEDLLLSLDTAFLACDLDVLGVPSNVRVLGKLDEKQSLTYEIVVSTGEVDASYLVRNFGEGDPVKQTAWNNRLASVSALGLIAEEFLGRTKKYKPLLSGG